MKLLPDNMNSQQKKLIYALSCLVLTKIKPGTASATKIKKFLSNGINASIFILLNLLYVLYHFFCLLANKYNKAI